MRIRGPFTRIIRIASREDGFALVLALGISVVLGIMGTTVMLYSSSNSSLASRSSFDAKAFTLAEAGVNDAVSILQNPSNNAQTAGLLCSDGAPLPCDLTHARVATYDDGVVKYWGNYDTTKSTWTINSYGYMRNPTGPNVGKLIRRITTTVRVRPSFMQPPNSMAWNYIIATRTGTPGGCDLSLNNSMNMQSSLYVMGNLCLQTPSQVTEGIDPTLLVVKGNLSMDVNTNVGTSDTRISEAHITGSCSFKGKTYACSDSSNSNVWASTLDTTAPPLTPPSANFDGWYISASPGPNQGCTQSSGTVPVFDTGDSARNNSVSGTFNLTPSASDYSCVVAAGGHTVGQLSWDHVAKKLTVYGTIYIDGSACVCYGYQNVPISYDGQATLYLTGTFQVSNSIFCGQIDAAGTGCDWSDPPSGWNPNNEMFMVVADGQGGQNPAGDGAQVKSSQFQGGLYTSYAIELDTSSQTEGPMIASTEILGQTIKGHSWTSITSVPAGAPGTPVVYAQPDPPGNFRG
jgi:Tfp pilus assembly protein PilX